MGAVLPAWPPRRPLSQRCRLRRLELVLVLLLLQAQVVFPLLRVKARVLTAVLLPAALLAVPPTTARAVLPSHPPSRLAFPRA
jgi:hypothetical protein